MTDTNSWNNNLVGALKSKIIWLTYFEQKIVCLYPLESLFWPEGSVNARQSYFLRNPEGRLEETDRVLQDFLQNKYKLDFKIDFERVYRMGKWNECSVYPRKSLPNSLFFKDREYIAGISQNAWREVKFTSMNNYLRNLKRKEGNYTPSYDKQKRIKSAHS